MKTRKAIAALSVVCLFSVISSADVLTLREGLNGYTGTRDDAGVHNQYGVENRDDSLYARMVGASGTVVGFDISAYESNISSLNSATLVMTFSNAAWFSGGTFAVCEPTQQWVEGEAFFYRATSSVYWNPSDAWNTSDGITMASQPDIDSQFVAANNTSIGRTGYAVSFDVTSLVADWLSGTKENKGFAVRYSSGSLNNNAFWAGKANATEAYRPTLVLDYTVPEPATASLVLAGLLGSLYTKRRRS